MCGAIIILCIHKISFKELSIIGTMCPPFIRRKNYAGVWKDARANFGIEATIGIF
jgi:hypothetical protein